MLFKKHIFSKNRLSESFEFDDADEEDDEESFDRVDRALREFARYKYFPKTKEELRKIIIKLIKERGPKGDFNDIYTGSIDDMSDLFNAIEFFPVFEEFSGNIGGWDVGNVKSMQRMFYNCLHFNQDLSKWNVRNVENMESMFCWCEDFNQDLSKWDVRNVKDMSKMFVGCTHFYQNLSGWKVNSKTNVDGMFNLTSSPIPDWYKNLISVNESFEFDDADEEEDEEAQANFDKLRHEFDKKIFFENYILRECDVEKLGDQHYPCLPCFERLKKDGDKLSVDFPSDVYGRSAKIFLNNNKFNAFIAPKYKFNFLYFGDITFYDGWCAVKVDEETMDSKMVGSANFINENGEFISKTGFSIAHQFYYGYAVVQDTNHKWYMIDTTGKDVFNGKRSDVCIDNFKCGVTPIIETTEIYGNPRKQVLCGRYINTNGEYAFNNKKFFRPEPFNTQFKVAVVAELGKSVDGQQHEELLYYIIDKNGNDVCNGKRFVSLDFNYQTGVSKVKLSKSGKSYFINSKGEFSDKSGNRINIQDDPYEAEKKRSKSIEILKKMYPKSCVWTDSFWTEEAVGYEMMSDYMKSRRKTKRKDPNGKLRNATWYAVVVALSELGPLTKDEIRQIVFPNGTSRQDELFLNLKKNGIIELITTGPNRNRYVLCDLEKI